MASHHSEHLHTHRLNSLCRICGGRSKTQQKQRPDGLSEKYTFVLHDFFGLIISPDTNGTVSSNTICSKCRRRLDRMQSADVPSQSNLSTVRSQLEDSNKIWTRYNPSVSEADCSVCQAFFGTLKGAMQGKKPTAGKQFKAKPASTKEMSDCSSQDKDEGDQSCIEADDSVGGASTSSQCDSSISITELQKVQFEPQASSTPHIKPPVKRRLSEFLTMRAQKIARTVSPTTVQSKTNSKFCQTLPKRTGIHKGAQTDQKRTVRPLEELKAPLTRHEEAYLTRLIRIKLQQSKDKHTVACKTKGQPIMLRKIIKPRKTSGIASTPTKRKRVSQLANIRKEVSGSSEADVINQRSTELRFTTTAKKTAIFAGAGVKKGFISAKIATKMRSKGLLTWAKERQLKAVARKSGVVFESEKKEREFQKKLLCGQVKIDQRRINCQDETTHEEKQITVPVPRADYLPTFITKLLDQYYEKKALTWHSGRIPQHQVWMKIGADSGGGSFKVVLSPLNVEKPNAKDNCFLILMAEVKDSNKNLRSVLEPLRDEINHVKEMTWKGKSIELFLSGDYEFLTKMYGLSGAAGQHPCLWCETTKEAMQSEPTRTGIFRHRDLQNLKHRHEQFMAKGGDKTKAKEDMNVILPNVWDIQLDHIAPPYLHILLGLVKKHHDLLAEEVHELDQKIAVDLAREKHPRMHGMTEGFKLKVRELRNRPKKMANPWKGLKPFTKHQGPVAQRLNKVLKDHKITPQAYYSGAFVGNHCNKYLKTDVYTAICCSVEAATYDATSKSDTLSVATGIKNKFLRLNELYSRVHGLVSSAAPLQRAEGGNAVQIHQAIEAIKNYMDEYRTTFVKKGVHVLPKHHILEAHCTHWMCDWGFGLGFHGEQGIEAMHGVINKLKDRAKGMVVDSERLSLIMREQWVQASPMLLDTPKKDKPKE